MRCSEREREQRLQTMRCFTAARCQRKAIAQAMANCHSQPLPTKATREQTWFMDSALGPWQQFDDNGQWCWRKSVKEGYVLEIQPSSDKDYSRSHLRRPNVSARPLISPVSQMSRPSAMASSICRTWSSSRCISAAADVSQMSRPSAMAPTIAIQCGRRVLIPQRLPVTQRMHFRNQRRSGAEGGKDFKHDESSCYSRLSPCMATNHQRVGTLAEQSLGRTHTTCTWLHSLLVKKQGL